MTLREPALLSQDSKAQGCCAAGTITCLFSDNGSQTNPLCALQVVTNFLGMAVSVAAVLFTGIYQVVTRSRSCCTSHPAHEAVLLGCTHCNKPCKLMSS